MKIILNKTEKNWITVLLLLLLLACQGKDQETPFNQSSTQEFPDQEGWDSILTSTTEGRVNAIIKYGHMAKYSSKKLVHFDQEVVVDFFNQNGQHTSRLTSEKGVLNEANNNVEAIGNVVVISDSGFTLKTERLRWDDTIQKILSDDFVMITTSDNDTLYGTGFESDQTLQNWLIKKPWGVTDRKVILKKAEEKLTEPAKPEESEEAVRDSSFEKSGLDTSGLSLIN